ncbi:hypothetical protein BU23DRAFT_492680, partial [Bimuria novae-zelandiae CBS 107.79]
GPPGSTYANGTFLLYLEMGEDYPMCPPQGRFVTPVYHPGLSPQHQPPWSYLSLDLRPQLDS